MAAEEVIWSGPGRLERGDTIEAQNGNCRLRMNGDGNVVVQRRLRALDDKFDRWAVSWDTGIMKREGSFVMELALDGNLEVYDEEGMDVSVVWTTNMVPDANAQYDIVMDSVCRLKIQKDGVDVWANILIPPFSAGQVLQKGEMFRMTRDMEKIPSMIPHDFKFHYTLVLQHDCNLVQFLGTDRADRSKKVWSPNVSLKQVPFDDCYLYLDPKGRVALYEGVFNHTTTQDEIRPNEYWSTPTDWIDAAVHGEEALESYEIVLQPNGTIFDW
eukprot:CAMPEP_0119011072 /NCGR_PEP_ID=MMETSP1176-20130426/5438_1 /TAXON_ID=265551 /ORGANISM="Synedropsis recta cf, Strain CCMP1620" /LENGTH=270 /DNA_ID=CAMNT_0006963841 /DNA_START=446 /DNA_END=1255 /DNA_ORIENTATION=+